ncbi:MAG TPA: hypothetical protein DCE41_02585 [Cytophagales bacterium]|nr:hypothetical protein [Cytophagales bacterium]HAA17915.1 hypothetical protein [Cytophagales bacterium]
MKNILLSLGLSVALLGSVRAQEVESKPSNLDFRTGTGISLLGTSSMVMLTVENELNYRITPHFTASLSGGVARSVWGYSESASYFQGNANVFVSPFRNTRYLDFRLGSGLSYIDVTEVANGLLDQRGNWITFQNEPSQRQSLGINFVVEYSLNIGERYLIGTKIYTQQYTQGDANTGLMLRAGFRI